MIIIMMTASHKDKDVRNGRIVHASTTYNACYKWGQTYFQWEQQQESRSELFQVYDCLMPWAMGAFLDN